MPAIAPSPSPSSRAVDVTLLTAVLAGTVLTIVGWTSVDRAEWIVAEHLRYFVVAWPIVALLLFVTRWSLPAMGLGVFVAVCAAFGQLGAALAVGALAWSSDTLGRLLLRRWPDTDALQCTLLGLTVHGTVVSLLAHLPIHYPGTYALLLALPLVIDRRAARRSMQLAASLCRGAADGGVLHRLIGAATITVVSVHVCCAIMPEVGFDALVTHLLVPMQLEHAHVFDFDVDRNVWAVMPILGDWLFAIGQLLAGETAARFVNLGCLLLLGALIRDLATWAGADRLGAAAATLIYLATPLTLTESSSLFVESSWSCFALGGAAAVFRAAARSEDDTAARSRHLVLGGALLGGALAAKAITMVVLPVLALVLLLGVRRWCRRDHLAAMLAGLLAFVAIGAVPYARAWLLTGNPVFPFFNELFRSPHYPFENFAPPPQFEIGTHWDTLYRITFDAGRYLEARAGAGGFHWLLLVVPVTLACLLRRHRRGLLLLGVAAAVTWLTFRQTAYLRYVLPSFALATAALGVALGGGAALGIGRAGRGALSAALVATVALDLVYLTSGTYYASLSLPAMSSTAGRDAYLGHRQPLRNAVALVNRLNTRQQPVAFFCQPFGAGLQATGLWTNWYNPAFCGIVLRAENVEQMGQAIAREGARYLLLTESWRTQPLRDLVRAVSDEVQVVGDVSVRRLRDEFRFREELLRAPQFETADAWQIVGDAEIDAGRGARVTATAPATQQVAVVARREYRLTAALRRIDAAVAADARLQINWLDAERRFLGTSLEVVACEATARVHSMDAVAPPDATFAVVFATGHGGEPVLFESLSLRN